MNAAAAPADAAPSWELLLQTRPRLNDAVLRHSHVYRGRPWTIFEDRLRGSFYRLDPSLSAIFDGADGSLSLQQRLDNLSSEQKQALNAEQVVETYLALLRARLFVDAAGQLPQSTFITTPQKSSAKALFKEAVSKPFAIRVPLFKPDRWLAGVYRRVGALFNFPMGLLSLTLVVWAAMVLPAHWSDLQQYFEARFLGLGNVILLMLLYPLIKTVHELAHGLAIKHWGGRVKEAGLMFLVFIPIPYVDASASSRFSSKWQRMAVAGAGIWAELVLSAIALWVWQQSSTGVIELIAFDVMVLAAGSTLLFNANPLLRFDGYYLLADAIEIPNLSSRSARYWGYLIRRYGLGLSLASPPMRDPQERIWLVTYGALAYLYRFGLSIVIALYLSTRFFVVGLMLAAWLLAIQLIRPLVIWAKESWQLAASAERVIIQRRVLAMVLALGLILFTPIPRFTVVQGIVQAPENTLVRAAGSGLASSGWITSGQSVAQGDSLLVLSDPEVDAKVAKLEAHVREVELRQSQALEDDLSQMAVFAERAVGLGRALDEAKIERRQLEVKSPATGTFILLDLRHLTGRWVEQGQLIGYVEDGAPRRAMIALDETDARKLRQGIEAIEVIQAQGSGVMVEGRLTQFTPAASDQLPSALLGSMAGGDIAVDARDENGTKTMAPTVNLEIQLSRGADDHRVAIGAAVSVRFKHQSQSLAIRSGLFFKRFWLEKISI